MEWLQSNWVWVALGLAFVALHLFGHGGHGHGHGGHSRRDRGRTDDQQATPTDHAHAGTPAKAGAKPSSVPLRGTGDRPANEPARANDGKGHRHGC